MGAFDLPENWVYVEYADGSRENVANTDDLTSNEAKSFKETWERNRNKKVVKVTLESNYGRVIDIFKYEE